MRRWRLVPGWMALGFALAGCGAPQGSRNNVAIGVIVPLSGPDAASGQEVVDGMKLAAGRDGVPMEILPRDSHGSPGVAIRRLHELADQERVLAIVGGWSAASGRVVASAAAARKVPFLALSPLTIPVAPTESGFFALHRLSSLGVAGARFAREDLAATTAGIAARAGSDVAATLVRAFREEFEGQGGRVAWTLEVDPSQRLPAAGATEEVSVVWIVGGGPVAGRSSDLGAAVEHAIFLVPEGWTSEQLAPLAASGRAVRFLSFFAPGDTSRVTREFLTVCDSGSVPPTAASALGWDAMLAIRQGVRAENASREGLTRALAGGPPPEGATGGSALGQGVDQPAVSAVTSEGLHFLHRVEVPVAPPSARPHG